MPDEEITLRSRLGFIGLGHLGSRIARRLVAAGFPMVVYDLNHQNSVDLAHAGARVVRHPEELATEVDVVLSCLPDELAVEAVYLKAGNVLRTARSGTRIIELSTISPEASLRLHRAGQKFNISVLDVGVSGSTPAAEAASGAEEDFSAVIRRMEQEAASESVLPPVA
jgi:3-hydroxyisobutyrate dehydrogenase-like beta-hydroxyacid dehydrogenase